MSSSLRQSVVLDHRVFSLSLPVSKCQEHHLLNYPDVIKNLCNNTFIQTIYVCDVLCVVTSVITLRKDLD
jgi:hypothetical protein